MNWTLKKIKVSELKEYKSNPRALTKKGLTDLENSINKFGIAEPPVLNTDLTIIGGHARKKTFQKLGIKEVNCYIPERELTEQEVKELNIRLNKNIAGEWDFDILANEFEIPELIEWGFEENELIGENSNSNIKETKLIAYVKSHILISFPPDQFTEIKKIIEKLQENNSIEIEISAN